MYKLIRIKNSIICGNNKMYTQKQQTQKEKTD